MRRFLWLSLFMITAAAPVSVYGEASSRHELLLERIRMRHQYMKQGDAAHLWTMMTRYHRSHHPFSELAQATALIQSEARFVFNDDGSPDVSFDPANPDRALLRETIAVCPLVFGGRAQAQMYHMVIEWLWEDSEGAANWYSGGEMLQPLGRSAALLFCEAWRTRKK